MRWVDVHARLWECSRQASCLTPSQNEAAASIVTALAGGAPYLNLWGPPGVGKSFLARHLAHHHAGVYVSTPGQPLPPLSGSSWVCVDNAPATRSDARSIYGKLQWSGAAAVLVVTQAPVKDSLFAVQLQCTAQDRSAVRASLATMFKDLQLASADHDLPQLWLFIRACLRAEGTENPNRG